MGKEQPRANLETREPIYILAVVEVVYLHLGIVKDVPELEEVVPLSSRLLVELVEQFIIIPKVEVREAGMEEAEEAPGIIPKQQ